MSSKTASTKLEKSRHEFLEVVPKRKKREMDHEAIVIWDELLVKALNSACETLFHRSGESYERFFREQSTSFDFGIIDKLYATENIKSPAAFNDSPMIFMDTHHDHGKIVLLCATMERIIFMSKIL